MDLESDKRRNIQPELDFSSARMGEARQAGWEEIESPSASHEPESPANTSRLMEEIGERELQIARSSISVWHVLAQLLEPPR